MHVEKFKYRITVTDKENYMSLIGDRRLVETDSLDYKIFDDVPSAEAEISRFQKNTYLNNFYGNYCVEVLADGVSWLSLEFFRKLKLISKHYV